MKRVLFSLFLVALGVRATTSIAQIFLGIHWVSWFPTLAMWSDFYGFYGNQLELLSKGLVPYRDFAYSYPPLFIYTLYPFFALGGIYAASTPIILADALSPLLIYLIVSLKCERRIAVAAALAYVFSPLSMIYVGYLWIGSQPVTFFILVSTYYILKRRPAASGLFLAIAVMYQQEALFVVPAFMVWQLLANREAMWKGWLAFCTVVIVCSAPFLLTAAPQYISYLSYGLLPVSNAGIESTNPQSSLVTSGILGVLSNCVLTTRPSVDSFTYCISYPVPLLTFWVNLTRWLGAAVQYPLLVLLIPVLYASRKDESIVQLIAAFSINLFLGLFGMLIHTVLAYYFIPLYALLFSASRTRISLALTYTATTIVLTVSASPFLEVLGSLSILSVAALNSQSTSNS
jgi:hypothetical protein